ncbi:hypothetical protein L3Y34_019574 [Caenorhabditis briggsae]|uniref:Uncharacterized protein n=1 Tax=Caenorhabditis briggsae TaxID=6238 RepID=A0AAE9IW93_CAEBR|nr:hypothetical protein L3Y34_019574 [Caenorhabditis briggsae]
MSTVFDNQFQSSRTQTRVYAGASKATPTGPSISEDEIFKAKLTREFPEYADRKKEKYTWKAYYERRVQKKTEKMERKLAKVTKKLKDAQEKKSEERKAQLIAVSHRSGSKGCGNASNTVNSRVNTSPTDVSKAARTTSNRRISPTTTSTFKATAPKKAPAPLMAKCLKMMKMRR